MLSTITPTITLVGEENGNSNFKQQFSSKDKVDSWIVKWKECLKEENRPEKVLKESMLKINPSFIPRNHRVEEAIYDSHALV